MKFFLISLFFLSALLCALDKSEYEDKTFYLAHAFFLSAPKATTTNYKKDLKVVPVNSKVKITSVTSKSIFVKGLERSIPSFELIHVKKHSRIDLDSLFRRSFKSEPVDLSKFSTEVRENILKGEVKLGMTREAVLLARGYPPTHKTPDLNVDIWRYWYRQLVQRNHIFSGNILYDGRQIEALQGYVPQKVKPSLSDCSYLTDSLVTEIRRLKELVEKLSNQEGTP
jgi:hypothetical protein